MPQFRKRPLVDEWVIIAPERAQRPRQLGLSDITTEDQFCPFCPANAGVTPPTIESWDSPSFDDEPWGIRAIPNKFPALRVEEQLSNGSDPLYHIRGGVGAHEVIIESPQHQSRWRDLPDGHLGHVFEAWRQRMVDLRGDQRLRCAVVFKNHGARAGATLDHVHSQLIALPLIPRRLQAELDGARDYFEEQDRCALCDMIERERRSGQRLIAKNDAAVAIAPFGSRIPFEVWILPTRHQGDFMAANTSQLTEVANLTTQILSLWDRAIGPVAYNLVLHCLPFDLAGEPYYHWHLEMLPRTGQVAGFEWASDVFINATPSEVAARHLRNLVAGQ